MNRVKHLAKWAALIAILVSAAFSNLGIRPQAAFAEEDRPAVTESVAAAVYEAEAPGNELSGNAKIKDKAYASGGKLVGDMFWGAELKINRIAVPETGKYKVTVYYIKGETGRNVYIRANDSAYEYYEDFPAGPNWDTVLSHDIYLNLNEGTNSIAFWDGGEGHSSIDIDKIEVSPSPGIVASAPVADPSPGIYDDAQTVSLSSATEGARIYYTADGSRPTERSLLYQGPIPVEKKTTIRAIAVKEGSYPSDVAEFAYTIDVTTYEAEDEGNEWSGGAQVVASGASSGGKRVGYMGGDATLKINQIEAPQTGKYKVTVYYSKGDDSRHVYIRANDDAYEYYDTFPAGPNWDTILSYDLYLNLRQGTNSISFWAGGGDYSSIDIDKIEVNRAPGVETSTPAADPAAGIYDDAQMVSLSSATEGAQIYYTTDGTRPTEHSLLYDGPFPVNRSLTVKAIAVKDGHYPSEVTTFRYTIGTVAYEAEAAGNELFGNARVKPGRYSSGGQKVSDMYFGADLKMNGIEVPQDGTYRITLYYIKGESDRIAYIGSNAGELALHDDIPMTRNWDEVKSYDLYLDLAAGVNSIVFSAKDRKAVDIDRIEVSKKPVAAAPTADLPPGKYAENQTVQLHSDTEGGLIYYTLNGETPTDGNILYSEPIIVNKNMAIKAVTVKEGMLPSVEASFAYTVGEPKFVIYEAEAPDNERPESKTFPGEKADLLQSGAFSGGYKVGNLYNDRALIFKNIEAKEDGLYKVKVYYAIGDGKERNVYVAANIGYSTNEADYRFYDDFAKTNDWNRVAVKEIILPLKGGDNTVTFWSGGAGRYSIDIDKIEVSAGPVPEQAAAPAADPPSGIYRDGQSVTLSSGTEGAAIHYTTDGSAPTAASPLYQRPLDVQESLTIRAVAMKAGIAPSEAAAFKYKIGRIASYEAEEGELIGRAGVAFNKFASGQKKVGGIFYGGGVKFGNIQVEEAGLYKLAVSYQAGDPYRVVNIRVNNGEVQSYVTPRMPDWNAIGELELTVPLNAGANTIVFTDAGMSGPDIDKIDVGPKVKPDLRTPEEPVELGGLVEAKEVNGIAVSRYENGVVLSNGTYAIAYYSNGTADYDWNGVKKARGISSSVRLDSGELLASKDYSEHLFAMDQVAAIRDGFGEGIQVTFINKEPGKPDLHQVYRLYPGRNYFLTDMEAMSADGAVLGSHYMAPVVTDAVGAVDLGIKADNRVLLVPYDNDCYIPSFARPIDNAGTSYEVTAVYDSDSRNGLVIGSVTHDAWKTGIDWTGANGRLDRLSVYGGASVYEATRDVLPHGSLTGTKLQSPTVFVGYYDDYRTGLEQYGEANAVIAPRLAFSDGVPEGVPVGWNSWSAYGGRLTYEDVVRTSDYFKQNLQDTFSNQGALYINLDYNTFTDKQLEDAVKHIKANGQLAGIYWKPFLYGGYEDDLNKPVEGTNGRYTYRDIVLKDAEGNVLPKYGNYDSFYALDPTHPGTKMWNEYHLGKFKAMGFQFIKLDFLSHGAMEGAHYDPSVRTGTQAYNYGMKYISDLVKDQMFISESIAPLFPSQYAHSRRISADVHADMGEIHYMLNALTNGWWQNGTIYPYADPDHMPFAKAGDITQAHPHQRFGHQRHGIPELGSGR